MSTPVDLNIVMPYGVTVESAGSRNAQIVTNSAQASSNIALKLPDGPCRVAASWDGPEAVRLVHTGHGYPVTIPAGGGIAPGWLLSALRRAKRSTCRTSRLRHSRRAGAAPSRSTRSTSSSSSRGGGVNGRRISAANHHLLNHGKRCQRLLPQRVRNISSALLRRADDYGDRARRDRLNPPVNGSRVQNQVPFCEHGEREAGRTVECGTTRGGVPLSVVLFQRRWGGLRDYDCEILTSVAGGGCVNDLAFCRVGGPDSLLRAFRSDRGFSVRPCRCWHGSRQELGGSYPRGGEHGAGGVLGSLLGSYSAGATGRGYAAPVAPANTGGQRNPDGGCRSARVEAGVAPVVHNQQGFCRRGSTAAIGRENHPGATRDRVTQAVVA